MNNLVLARNEKSPLSEHRAQGRGRRAFGGMLLFGVAVLLLSYLPGCTESSKHQRGIFAQNHSHGIHTRLDWALAKVDATGPQREQVEALLKSLDADAATWQEARSALKARFILALQAEQVSLSDLMQIKADGVALADQALSRTIDTTLKVSEVLTSTQRQELAARWKGNE